MMSFCFTRWARRVTDDRSMVSAKAGWIALHRKLLESAEWRTSTPQHRAVLIGVLLMTNHKKTRYHDAERNRHIVVERGQLLTTISKIAEQSRVSKSSVVRALEKFGERGTGFWKVEPHRNFSIITIKNYDLYQAGS